MNPSPVLTDLLTHLEGVKRNGAGFVARCPAHEDRTPSLTVSEGREGRVLLHCHAGCAHAAILAALGLRESDLFVADARPVRLPASRSPEVAVYDYRDETGALLFQVVRHADKSFRQRRPDPAHSDRWLWQLNGTRRVLYRLGEVQDAATAGRVVFVAEGEKDADSLAALGLVATTNPGGAGKWRDDYREALRGAHVVVLPDNDDAGRAHARTVVRSVQPVAASTRLVELPALPIKGDVSDWLAAGGDRAALERIVSATAPEAEPAPVATSASGYVVLAGERATFRAEVERNRAPVAATPTGFAAWDAACRDEGGRVGLARGWHIVLAGKPGAGKSLMGLHHTAAALGAGVSVCYVSLEMSRHQLLTRLLAIATNTDIASLERGPYYREADYQAAAEAFVGLQATHGASLTLLDRPPCDWPTLAPLITQHIAAGAALVVFDYLQLMTMPGADTVPETTRQVSAAVRRLAVERHITTLALSQFNRATTFGKESPTMHGLMGGSALENDADQVVLLDHAAVEYTPRGKEMALTLAKNRHGPLATIPVVWDRATLRVREIAAEAPARGRYDAEPADVDDDTASDEPVRVRL